MTTLRMLFFLKSQVLGPDRVEMDISHIPDLFSYGTSEGAKKGWETRRRNGWKPKTTPHPKKEKKNEKPTKTKRVGEQDKPSSKGGSRGSASEKSRGERPSSGREPSIQLSPSEAREALTRGKPPMLAKEELSKIAQGKDIGGMEHNVYHDAIGKRYYKLPSAKWGGAGLHPDSDTYLQSREIEAKMFPALDTKIHGFTTVEADNVKDPIIKKVNGVYTITYNKSRVVVPVVSQAELSGTHPTQDELYDSLKKGGWSPMGVHQTRGWTHSSGRAMGDVKEDNFIKTKTGDIVPIDVTWE